MHDRLAAAESRRAALLQNMEALAQVLEDGEKGGERRQLERSLRGVSEALGESMGGAGSGVAVARPPI